MGVAATPSAPPSSIRVLVVDDDSILVRSLQRILCLQGFEVDGVFDARGALARLAERDYDVMLLDLRLGGTDGMEIFSSTPDERLPATIIHSSHVDVRVAVLATRAGVADVMQKPVPDHVLASRIRELAAERRARGARADRGAAGDPNALDRIVGESAKASALRSEVRRVARYRDVPVLVQGPTGSGKEVVAEALHAMTCPNDPFVSVNCAAVPESLFESELFGHEAGAFTNAKSARVGLLEEAASGTLFLDEIGEMPHALQAKLLRVLETRQFRRLGGTRTKVFSARVVSATNRPLTSSLGGVMRPDLFFRLAGYTLRVPSLADRAEDIPALARHFLAAFQARHALTSLSLGPDALRALMGYSWPGNLRELRSVVETAAILTHRGPVGASHVEGALRSRAEAETDGGRAHVPAPHATGESGVMLVADEVRGAERSSSGGLVPPDGPALSVASAPRAASLPDLQRELILRAFESSARNLSRAAADLGIPRSTLRARLRRYGVR